MYDDDSDNDDDGSNDNEPSSAISTRIAYALPYSFQCELSIMEK